MRAVRGGGGGEFAGAVRSGAQYGPGVKARVRYLQQYQMLPYARTDEAMRDLFGCPLPMGTVAIIVRKCSDALLETELKIKRALRRSAVIHADETGLRVEGRLHFVHVASNSRLAHYAATAGRGQTATEEAACCRATAAPACITLGRPTASKLSAGTTCAGRTCRGS